jgi:hypothetical protein
MHVLPGFRPDLNRHEIVMEVKTLRKKHPGVSGKKAIDGF